MWKMNQIDGGDAERYNEVESSGHWRIVEVPREDPLWLRASWFSPWCASRAL